MREKKREMGEYAIMRIMQEIVDRIIPRPLKGAIDKRGCNLSHPFMRHPMGSKSGEGQLN